MLYSIMNFLMFVQSVLGFVSSYMHINVYVKKPSPKTVRCAELKSLKVYMLYGEEKRK